MNHLVRLAVLAGCLLAMPVAATAQTARPPSPPPAPAGASGTLDTTSPAFVVTPDFRFTDVDGGIGGLAGGYAGWTTNDSVLIGGGAYWLANRSDEIDLWYGGAVIEWLADGDQRIGFGTRGLVGAGRATLARGAGATPLRGFDVARFGSHGPATAGSQADSFLPVAADVLVTETFFVAEPQVTLVWHVTRWCRVNLGAGYRVTAGAGTLDERLHGASGSVAIQFGRK